MAVTRDQARSWITPQQSTAVPTHAPPMRTDEMTQGQLEQTSRFDEGRQLIALAT